MYVLEIIGILELLVLKYLIYVLNYFIFYLIYLGFILISVILVGRRIIYRRKSYRYLCRILI